MRAIFALAAVGCLLLPRTAGAHIQLTSPPDRFTNNSLSPGPCGSGTRSNKPPSKLVPGQTLVVTWKEVVSHAGHYRISLSANESDFTDPQNLSIPDPTPAWVLLDGIADKTGNQTYSQSVRIPDKECSACVLQVIQVASGGSDGTNTGTLGAIYHACADVSVGGSALDGGTSRDASIAFDAAPTRSDGPALVDGVGEAGRATGADVPAEISASSGGATGMASSAGGTGGHLAGGEGAASSTQAVAGQSGGGRVSSGGSSIRVDSAAESGGRSSSTAAQGGGGGASLGDVAGSGGASVSGGASGAATSATSRTDGSGGGGSSPAAGGGCQIGRGPRPGSWLMLSLVLVIPALLRRKFR